jgi:hypothetical protein
MYNDYYLLKKIEEVEGNVAYASVQDSFTYMGEVVETPYPNSSATGTLYDKNTLSVGDKVIFLKGSGEDIGELKAVKFEDIIKKI